MTNQNKTILDEDEPIKVISTRKTSPAQMIKLAVLLSASGYGSLPIKDDQQKPQVRMSDFRFERIKRAKQKRQRRMKRNRKLNQ